MLVALAGVSSYAVNVDLNGHSLGVHEGSLLFSSLQTRCVLEGDLDNDAQLTLEHIERKSVSLDVLADEVLSTFKLKDKSSDLVILVDLMFDPYTVPTDYLAGLRSTTPQNLCRW